MPDGFETRHDGGTAVVVGVDGSETSLRAAAYAVGVCRRQGSRLVVVYAREPGGGIAQLMDTTGSSSAAALRLQDEVERMLRQSQTLAEAEGIRSELQVRTGDPYQVLSAVAREVRADCVVVGSSASIGHRIAGSLAVRLVRNARWPVTVVP
ncbi:universal stress protein [Cellulomonas endometrii]|uniref:universal stress protein n=1 Tax=Cellulomonas endometrii TaxID=3036301 RepID=UPI0024AE8788|nr:universal stress protein [Cellulomonas endometrii]